MISSGKFSLIAAGIALLGLAAGQANAQVGYTLDVTTGYGFSLPADTIGGGSPSPDTGFFTITNNGSSVFNGIISDVAISNFAGDVSFASGPLTLNPGDHVSIAIDSESSNIGGFNGPFDSPQPGVQIKLDGSVSSGSGSELVALSVFDSDIHSGVPRTSAPSGLTTDAYVLQGGDPDGFDTGDDFEVSQAPGHFRFFEPSSSVPEPGAMALLAGIGVSGAGFLIRRRR